MLVVFTSIVVVNVSSVLLIPSRARLADLQAVEGYTETQSLICSSEIQVCLIVLVSLESGNKEFRGTA